MLAENGPVYIVHRGHTLVGKSFGPDKIVEVLFWVVGVEKKSGNDLRHYNQYNYLKPSHFILESTDNLEKTRIVLT